MRKEEVFALIEELTSTLLPQDFLSGKVGFEAGFLAEKMGYDRSNVSRDLNALNAEGRIIKINGRPVTFLEKKQIERLLGKQILHFPLVFNSAKELLVLREHKGITSLDSLVGAQGSLSSAIQQAKASIMYPPKGLNILLTGETGVGKTTFSEFVYQYAVEVGRVNKERPFIIFNCSEYAETPQLLLAQLFGYVKGAFTGAETDKEGLVGKAEGSILLLDEIHRLPPEGQEMLFLLIDKGVYRRLGESGALRKANILLIGATTEDLQSSLLKTFLRRFSMVIHIPDLKERGFQERFTFINEFFRQESENIDKPIKASPNVMKQLLIYKCPGNVGQLKGDIQLLCARGFMEATARGESEIYISGSLLPKHIAEALCDSGISKEIARLLDEDPAADRQTAAPSTQIGMIVLSEKAAAAETLAAMVNQRTGNPLCKGLGHSPEDSCLLQLADAIEKQDFGNGVLIFQEQTHPSCSEAGIQARTGTNIKLIPDYTLQMIVEAADACSESEAGGTLEEIAQRLIENQVKRYGRILTGKQPIAEQKKRRILTTCITGKGSAVKIGKIIEDAIPKADRYDIVIEPLELGFSEQAAGMDTRHILAVVGTVDLNWPHIPYISLDELVLADGMNRLKALILKDSANAPGKDEQERVKKLIRDSCLFLDPDKTYAAAIKSFEQMDIHLEPKRQKSLEIRYVLHFTAMLERLILKQILKHPHIDSIKEAKAQEFERVRKALAFLEDEFSVYIPDAEVGFFIDLLYTQ